jgi:hypothetical protein
VLRTVSTGRRIRSCLRGGLRFTTLKTRRSFSTDHRALKFGGGFSLTIHSHIVRLLTSIGRMATQVRTDYESPLTSEILSWPNHIYSKRPTPCVLVLYFAVIRYSSSVVLWIGFTHIKIATVRESSGKRGTKLWKWIPMRTLDQISTRVPGLNWLAWNMVM